MHLHPLSLSIFTVAGSAVFQSFPPFLWICLSSHRQRNWEEGKIAGKYIGARNKSSRGCCSSATESRHGRGRHFLFCCSGMMPLSQFAAIHAAPCSFSFLPCTRQQAWMADLVFLELPFPRLFRSTRTVAPAATAAESSVTSGMHYFFFAGAAMRLLHCLISQQQQHQEKKVMAAGNKWPKIRNPVRNAS